MFSNSVTFRYSTIRWYSIQKTD